MSPSAPVDASAGVGCSRPVATTGRACQLSLFALRTSVSTTFSSADESVMIAHDVGHIVPSSSRAGPKNAWSP